MANQQDIDGVTAELKSQLSQITNLQVIDRPLMGAETVLTMGLVIEEVKHIPIMDKGHKHRSQPVNTHVTYVITYKEIGSDFHGSVAAICRIVASVLDGAQIIYSPFADGLAIEYDPENVGSDNSQSAKITFTPIFNQGVL